MRTRVDDAPPYPPVDGTQPCASEDPEIFFQAGSAMANEFGLPRALETCGRCPFRRPCLAYALVHDFHGVWGGTTRPQRVALRNQHGITTRAVTTDGVSPGQAELALEMSEDGMTNKAIAEALGINAHTVASHLSRIRSAQ